ncbi:MAG: TIR domain-containing protein [Rhodoglobus sp.]|nr:TIR domain-containing protein [Rhodoglobus sp.]
MIEGKVAPAEITVRFDYRDGDHGMSFSVHDDWKIDASPYAAFEPHNPDQGLPALEELNYVVVRLAGDASATVAREGDPSAPRRERGFMPLPGGEVAVVVDEPLFVLGHPMGETMKISVEARGVIGYNANRTRLRHRVSTAPGSSGSPVFNLRGDLIALHAGRDTGPVPRFRMAIPVGAIGELLRDRGKLDELFSVPHRRHEPPLEQAQGEQARDVFPSVHEKLSRKRGESMGRNVFFSFHFERDHWRVGQVRNCQALIDLPPYLDWAEWEKIKRQGAGAIRAWIDSNLRGASVTCVLIGNESWTREWMIYEIEQSYLLGKGMVGIWIHDLLDQNGKTDSPGQNPFQYAKTPDGRSVESAMIAAGRPIAHYNWKAAKASLHDASGATNLAAWVEAAAKAVGR